MADAFRGANGSGSFLAYTVPRDHYLRLEMLSFTLTTDSTIGVHAPAVTFTDATISQVTARLWDWNEGGPNMTLYYTFGIGLRPFNCTITTGMMVEHDLPDTILAPETQITLASVNAAGVTIAADTFSQVTLYGTLIDAVDDTAKVTVNLLPGLLPASVAA